MHLLLNFGYNYAACGSLTRTCCSSSATCYLTTSGFECCIWCGLPTCGYCLRVAFTGTVDVRRSYIAYSIGHAHQFLRFGSLLASSGMSASVAVRMQPRTPRKPLRSAVHAAQAVTLCRAQPRKPRKPFYYTAHGRARRACGVRVPRMPRTCRARCTHPPRTPRTPCTHTAHAPRMLRTTSFRRLCILCILCGCIVHGMREFEYILVYCTCVYTVTWEW